MIKSGIINENEVIELENNDLISYLYNLIDKSTDNKNAFEIYKQSQFFWSDLSVIDYFVKVLGFVIIYDKVVYFQSEVKSELIDKIDYIKNGFQLKKLPKMIYKNGKFIKYLSSIQQEIEIAEFEHSINPENDLKAVQIIGNGEGQYISKGKTINIKWSKASAKDPIKYTTNNGSELIMIPGQSYICVVPLDAQVDIS